MQTELFELNNSALTPEAETPSKTSVLEKTFLTLRLDQTIGLVLVLLVVYVLSFSWGFEKGKHSVHNSQIIKTVQPQQAPALPENLTVVEETPSLAEMIETAPAAMVPADSAVAKTDPKPGEISSARPAGKYTIQHIIYVTKSAAEREIKKLSEKGQAAFIIPSGKYLQVCVSGFQTKKEADQSLRQLRSQRIISGDAYVRPLPA